MPFGNFVCPDHLGGDVAGNGISKLFFTIISAVAEAERDPIVQRSLDVKSDQRRRGRHLGGKRDATAAEANAATAQVRGLVDRILDGEAAAMAVEMIAAGLLEIDEKRQGGPHLRELQAVRLKIDRRRREQERDPAALVEQHNWINFLDVAAKAEERAWLDYMRRLFSDATAKSTPWSSRNDGDSRDQPAWHTTAGNAKRSSHHVQTRLLRHLMKGSRLEAKNERL